jgi:hypothetical protein
MRTASKLLTAVAALTVAGVASLAAQNNASINVTAQVQSPITVTAANALAFGTVFPGVNKSIPVTDANAGRFNVTGQASTPVSLSFVLPANLINGANNLPIGNWTGHFNTTASPTGGTNFTPSASAQAATLSGTGALFVYVGAQVTPSVAQVAGTYSGTVQMTVVY